MDDDVDDPLHPGPSPRVDYGAHIPVPDAKLELTAEEKDWAGRPDIKVGDDGRARLEKDMGLDIDPKTGRAYESQGDFHNLGLGAGGRFYNGLAAPRVVQCDGCEARVAEDKWGRGFHNCGGFDFGGQFFLCPSCVLRALALFPRIRGIVAAMNGGNLERG